MIHREMARVAGPAWDVDPPSFPGSHLPGGVVALHADPAPRWPIAHRHIRVLHAVMTRITGPHHPAIPVFALGPFAGPGLGWAAYISTDEIAAQVARRDHDVDMFGRPTTLTCGPLLRLRAPSIAAGCHRFRMSTRTPIMVRGVDPDRISNRERSLAQSALLCTLDAWLPRRVGVNSVGNARMFVREVEGRAVEVPIGGHLGVARGWFGSMLVEANAPGAWLLRLAEQIGCGGRVAYGFGQIRLEVA